MWPLAQPNIAKKVAAAGWEGVKKTGLVATLAESVIFPDISKVQTLILVILNLN